jgi:hypothetical protein
VVDAKVGGKLAQLGSRIVDGFARRMAQDFFTRFQEKVEPPKLEDIASEADTSDGEKQGWFKRTFNS